MITDPWLLVMCVFGFLTILGVTSGLINERLWVSEPLACMLLGIALGPIGLGLLRLDVPNDPAGAAALREVARVTLAIAVAGAAMRLPARWIRQNRRGLLVALGPGMLLMWAIATGVAYGTLGLPLLTCMMIGAAVSPTDPVLSSPILTGRLARRVVPTDLRHALTAESGVNDGLALPLVLLPILLMEHAPAQAGGEWLVKVVAWEIGSAVVVGTIAGWLAAQCLSWARRRPDAVPSSLLAVTLALALAVLGAVRALDADGILAAFIAGAWLNNGNRDDGVDEHHERFTEALSRFFDLPVMFMFGAAVPWQSWMALSWSAVLFAAGILVLRRPLVWLALGWLMPWTSSVASALFAGWFGPVGVAALFYAMLIQQKIGSEIADIVWPTISVAVAASVLAHGVSGTPLTWLYGRLRLPEFAQAILTKGRDPLILEDIAADRGKHYVTASEEEAPADETHPSR